MQGVSLFTSLLLSRPLLGKFLSREFVFFISYSTHTTIGFFNIGYCILGLSEPYSLPSLDESHNRLVLDSVIL